MNNFTTNTYKMIKIINKISIHKYIKIAFNYASLYHG